MLSFMELIVVVVICKTTMKEMYTVNSTFIFKGKESTSSMIMNLQECMCVVILVTKDCSA